VNGSLQIIRKVFPDAFSYGVEACLTPTIINVFDIVNGYYPIEGGFEVRVSTLAELRDALITFCEQHPELADEAVSVHSECGYAGAHIASPVTLYKSKGNESISIYTDDDWDIEDNERFVVYKTT
jgi:hypothetical protein